MSLDAIGISEGTDKSSTFQDYLRHYEERFRSFRDEAINILEIGVLGGNSLRMWKKFFPRATLVGVDIMDICRRHAEDRIIIEIGSQDDAEFLGHICDRHPPTVVIDDGSHQAKHMLATLQCVFPRLLPGGWYVIEDLHFCGGRDSVPITPYDYLCNAAKSLMTAGRGVSPGQPVEEWTRSVDRLDFVSGVAFLRKADSGAAREALAVTEKLVAQSGRADNWFFLAGTLLREGPPWSRAEHAIREAVTLNPLDARYHWRLSEILERKHEWAEAIASAERAMEYRRRESVERGWSEEVSELERWNACLTNLVRRQDLENLRIAGA
jgi:tetratricopeptide (TPR) repeat protein